MSQAQNADIMLAERMDKIAADLRSGRATHLMSTDGCSAEHVQMTPLPDEDWEVVENTGRFTFSITVAYPEGEAKYAQKILDRMAKR